MSQMGIHLIAGISNKQFKLFKNQTTALGFLIGNIFPDLDFLILIPLRFINRDLAITFHRSFSHSIFLVLFFLIISILIRNFSNSNKSHLFLGLGFGIFLHIIFDYFMWFSSVDFLWPLNLNFNLYRDFQISNFGVNIVGSFETACYGLYILYLRWLFPEMKDRNLWLINKYPLILFALTLIQIPFAYFFNNEIFEIFAYGAGILFGFFPSIFLTINTINQNTLI